MFMSNHIAWHVMAWQYAFNFLKDLHDIQDEQNLQDKEDLPERELTFHGKVRKFQDF